MAQLNKKGVSRFEDLTDTEIENATAYDILQYIAGKWKNKQDLELLGGGEIYLKANKRLFFDA